MNKGISSKSLATTLAMAAIVSISNALIPVHACGLEPGINGGITISYPGAIDVAVAVASARNNGLLPPPGSETITNEARLQNMLADLRRLQVRFNGARGTIPDGSSSTFSLVLVGPGLWSHYRMTAGGVLARYHTEGPVAGKAVVLTHATALHALLAGNLSIEQATELGLIAYSGRDTAPIKRAFEISFQSKT